MNSDGFRFSIQFNLKREEHRKALEILTKIKKGDKSEFCINCILGKVDENQELKNLIATTIESCLKDISITDVNTAIAPSISANTVNDRELDIMDGVLDFMTSFD